MRRIWLVLLVLTFGAKGEDADALFKQGVAKIQAAQSDHSQLIQAADLLARAGAIYEHAGDDAKVVAVNSCLYWVRKKFTLADAESIKTHTDVSQRVESSVNAIPASASTAMLEKAQAFAQSHPDESLLIAIRYFEIADRFPDTPDGRKAMSASLSAMQKVGESSDAGRSEGVEKAQAAVYKPDIRNGKVYIASEPSGAIIRLLLNEGPRELAAKTPALVQIPKGRQTLELIHTGMKTATLEIDVDEKAIIKPSIVKMQPITVPLDIVFEEGWQVFIDAKPTGGDTRTPCTVEAPLGAHTIILARDGFADMSQKVDVKESGERTIEFKTKPYHGTSTMLRQTERNRASAESDLAKAIVGKWKVTVKGLPQILTDEFLENKTWKQDKETMGKWSVQNNRIVLDYIVKRFGTATLEYKENDTFTGRDVQQDGAVLDLMMERVK